MEKRTVKGSHVLQVQDWIDRRLGAGSFIALAKEAGEDWSIVLPIAWYSIENVNKVLRKASQQSHVSVEDMATEISRLNAEKDLTSFYRMFLRVAQPQRVLSFTPKLWRTYVSFAEATAVLNEEGRYVGQGDGFPEELLDWGCGCWRGFIPAAIKVAGGKHVESKIINRWKRSDGLYAVQLQVEYR